MFLLVQVLERKSNGPWRGFILQEDLTTRSGYFPSIYVRLCANGKNRSKSIGQKIIRLVNAELASLKHSFLPDAWRRWTEIRSIDDYIIIM